MKTFIFAFTERAIGLSKILKKEYNAVCYAPKRLADNDITPIKTSLNETVRGCFDKGNKIIFVSACGIAVRAIAPFVKDKTTDPCVIAIDEFGHFVTPLLSGHIGGGNELAIDIANKIGAVPVISTATDLNNKFAVDVFAVKNNLIISDMKMAKRISADLLSGKRVGLSGIIPKGTVCGELDINSEHQSNIYISHFNNTKSNTLHLIPKNIVLGIGCKKNTDFEKLSNFIDNILYQNNINPMSICSIASIDIKKNEAAIVGLSKKYGVDFVTYSAEELSRVSGDFAKSDFVKSITGVDNVCERACVLCSDNGRILMHKTAKDGMTAAIAIKEIDISF